MEYRNEIAEHVTDVISKICVDDLIEELAAEEVYEHETQNELGGWARDM